MRTRHRSGHPRCRRGAMPLQRFWRTAKRAASAWVDDHAQSMGAALSYYTVFSLAPLLLIAISVAGLVFGQGAARIAIVEQLQQLMGEAGAEAIEQLLQHASKPAEGITGFLVGAAVLVVGAT